MTIYLDDQHGGHTITGNLFQRCSRAVFIGGGDDNIVANNLFLDCHPSVHINSRGMCWLKAATDDPQGTLRTRFASMPVTSDLWQQCYPNLAGTLEDEPTVDTAVSSLDLLPTCCPLADAELPARRRLGRTRAGLCRARRLASGTRSWTCRWLGYPSRHAWRERSRFWRVRSLTPLAGLGILSNPLIATPWNGGSLSFPSATHVKDSSMHADARLSW